MLDPLEPVDLDALHVCPGTADQRFQAPNNCYHKNLAPLRAKGYIR